MSTKSKRIHQAEGDRTTLPASRAMACTRLGVIVCAFATTHIASAGEYALDLEIVNVQAGEGFLEIELHNSALTYLSRDEKQTPFRKISVPVDRDRITLQFKGVPPGRYAFTIYQDVNGNGHFDSNFIGLPREPFGFSNNLPIRFGPPSFMKASFKVTGNQRIGVELR